MNKADMIMQNMIMQKMKKFTPFEIGWLAAVIDGEGNIDYRIKDNNYRIQVYSSNKEFLLHFAKIVDYRGKIYTIHTSKKRLSNKKIYSLCIGNKLQVLNILLQIKDHLIIKRKDAENAINNKRLIKTYCLKRLMEDEKK